MWVVLKWCGKCKECDLDALYYCFSDAARSHLGFHDLVRIGRREPHISTSREVNDAQYRLKAANIAASREVNDAQYID